MAEQANFDITAAHTYFAVHCFNQAWDLMEKRDRTLHEDRLMVALNQASIYHWTQRPDCSDKRLSIGYWQASRIQTLLGNADEARRYGEICLTYSVQLQPFYLGYAFEALARAEFVAGNATGAADYAAKALAQAAQVVRQEDRDLLEADLANLPRP